jgi:curved DNA-binding protein CbpA
MKNPYEVLNVKKDATIGDIKLAYRTLSKKYHPDLKGDPAVFQEINQAYNVLSDEKSRKEYDETGDVKEQINRREVIIQQIFIELKNILRTMTSEALKFEDIIKKIKDNFKSQNKADSKKIAELKLAICNLKNSKNRITIKDGKHNIFTGFYDQEINVISEGTKKINEIIEMRVDAIKLLDDYSYRIDEEIQNGYELNINIGSFSNIFDTTSTGASGTV